MKKLTKYALLLAALALGFAFTSCQQDSGDNTPAVKYYTVSFNSNGGTEVKSQKVESGKKATKPADPTKQETATEAFTFDNWYTSTDGGTTLSDTAFDFDTAITDNITLYAKWIEYIELKDCSEIRTMFETLCDYDSNYPSKFNKTITRFAKAEAKPASAENYIDAAGNRIPLWYDEAATTLYYYLEPGKKMSLRTSDGKNSLFNCMRDATSIETKDFDTSNVTNMSQMFCHCSSLTALDVSKFNTSKVTDMSLMFSTCSSLTALDVSKFDTSKVTDMSYMFYNTSFTALDVSKFDTSKVTDMSYMFYNCSSLTALDVSKFDTSKVTDIRAMFQNCSSLTELDVSNFDTSNVTRMWYMFQNCSSLTTIFASDKFVTDAESSEMFKDCTKLKGGAGTVYDANHTDKEYARIDVAGTPGYFTAK